MLKNRVVPSMLLAAAVLSACNSMPNHNVLLDDARSDYRIAQEKPNVVQLAAPELSEAALALEQANAAFSERKDEETVTKLADLAKKKIATTQEIAKRKAAELTVANSGRERDQLRLEQRTAEADKAKRETNIAQNQVAVAQAQTVDAQRMTAEAEARTRHLEAMLADMSATKTARGMMVNLSDVLFDVDQDRLRENGMHNVQKLAEFMKQYPQRVVLIEGHTDSTGSSAHNMDLSNRRAEAVGAALERMGIARNRISIRGYGEGYPVAGNDTAADRQLNRRVEVFLSEDNARIAPR